MATTTTSVAALPIQTTQDLIGIGDTLARSGIMGIRNPADGVVIAATCIQEKISFLKFSETYHIVNGRPAVKSEAMLANFYQLGGEMEIVERSADRAEAKFTFKKASFVSCLTWQDAQALPVRNASGEASPEGQLEHPETAHADALGALRLGRSAGGLPPGVQRLLHTRGGHGLRAKGAAEAASADPARPGGCLAPCAVPRASAGGPEDLQLRRPLQGNEVGRHPSRHAGSGPYGGFSEHRRAGEGGNQEGNRKPKGTEWKRT